jgi:hypothetical protein
MLRDLLAADGMNNEHEEDGWAQEELRIAFSRQRGAWGSASPPPPKAKNADVQQRTALASQTARGLRWKRKAENERKAENDGDGYSRL